MLNVEKEKFSLRFFIDYPLLKELSENADKEYLPDIDFAVDCITIPAHFSFTNSNDEIEYKFNIRNSYGVYPEPDFQINYKVGEKPEHKTGTNVRMTEGKEESMMPLFLSCYEYSLCLAEYIDTNQLLLDYPDLDFETEGILLYKHNDEIKDKLVKGHERPDLMCISSFDLEEKMSRPYMDEITQSLINEYEAKSDEDNGFETELEAAKNGDVEAMVNAAEAYRSGEYDYEDVEINLKDAFYWMNKAAESGSAIAMYNVALFYAAGTGVNSDFEKAVEWMEKAAENGDADAPIVLETFRNYAQTAEKAQKGDAQAQAELAKIIMEGQFQVCPDEENADFSECFEWARKSANQGNGYGMWLMALSYMHGRGVEENPALAVEYYRKGADIGNRECQQGLGCEYIFGENIEKDEKKAFELFKKSAEQGYGLAMRNLGQCYQVGTGCEDDMDKAIEWYEKSLEVDYDDELAMKVMLLKSLEE